MGAKAPEKLKLRRQPCKCEVCGRKFLNISALTSHRKFVHKTTAIESKRLSVTTASDLRSVKVIKKRVESPAVSKMLPAKVANKNIAKVTNEDFSDKKTINKKKIEFKCPKCAKVFSVYFSAYRHIQKNHCVDKHDQPVQPNSSDLIRPIRVEMCDSCNEFLPVSEEHICMMATEDKVDRFMCLGCQKSFDGLLLFEQHVKVLHSACVDYLYFPNEEEFTAYKTELEEFTNIKYKTLAPSEESTKQTYHCTHEPPLQTGKTLLCPSSLSVRKLENGFQVVYFKEHFGHSSLDLPPAKYKKNSILPFYKDIQHIGSDENLYQQFKTIINNVTSTAAKADLSVLCTLLDRALTMALVLNNTEQEEQTTVNKNMTDDQITQVLSEVKTYPNKRKADTVKSTKLNRTAVESNESSKSTSLTNKPVVSKNDVQSLPSTPIKKSFVQSSPSFNDTYKDFVDQNFKSGASDTSTPKKSLIKKKAVVKTKIGQFKVKPSLSPKGPSDASPIKINPNESPKMARSQLSPKISRPSLSPKRTTHSGLLAKKTRPSLSPKRPKAMSPKTPKTIKHFEFKIRPDFEYEVKEQENDCNILILKI